MKQATEWLEKLGLSEYAQRFVDNAIDLSVLPDLTDQDLEKIGVLLGHRRKILKAIAALNSGPAVQNDAAKATEPSATPPTPALPIDATGATGERRYLTVMFCDLVGSTAISAQLDAEEWRDLVGTYLDAASAAVAEMGGHVAKKLGDGLMCLFGYPLAHENDAERAARAALSIQRALTELNRKNAGTANPELIARIGLESGPAVLDASGEVYGEVANIAARVQALAEPGAVLVTAQVQRQVAGLFVTEERGMHALKGVPEPTTLYRLVRASGGGRRSGQRNLTPLVGRDEEIAMLMRRWERARQGDGQLVLIVGEPGIGKSRLTEEFHIRLRDVPHTWVEWTCSQLLQNTAFHPIAEWGRQRFGGPDVPAEQRLADLENTLALVKLNPAENIPLLAPMLDIPLPKERVPAFPPDEMRRRQLTATTNWAIASARIQPVVLALEDVHWADPTTLEVLRGTAERGALAPLLVLITARPEFKPPWGMRSHHSTISLAPLDRAQVRLIVGELAARHALPKDVIDGVTDRTGGVPLFVEEVTRLLLERGEQGGIQAIPLTLQQSLMARLDRLGPAREVAQIGAVIGRGFSYLLLRDVAGIEDAALQAALEKLAEADIVLVQGLPPESDYRFKHALIQDAAYENLLKSRRQVLHRRVAETLRDRFADTAAAQPEVLAHHFTQAGLTDAAIEWWGKAGDQALRRSAFQEAIAHLGKAIEMADREAEVAPGAAAASASSRLKLQTNLGRAVMWSKGFGAEETRAVYARAREFATNVDDPAERFAMYYGQWTNTGMRAGHAAAYEIAETFLRETDGAAATPEISTAHRMTGLTLLMRGHFIDAKTYLDEALRIYDPHWSRDERFRLGPEPGLTAMAYLASTEWLLGNAVRARNLIKDAVARSIDAGDIPTLASSYAFAAQLEVLRDDPAAASKAASIAANYTRENDLAVYSGFANTYLGWARAMLGEHEIGLAGLQQGISAHTQAGNKAWLPLLEALLAQVEAEGGQSGQALSRITEALALANEISEHWVDSFLHRIRGEILLKRDPNDSAHAEEAFLTAIAVAQQQKARSFELRAALSLAKLYQSTGRAAEAHAVLAPALEGFSATPEFPEIAPAQALLAVLADTDEVKSTAATRQRRLKLQTSYGQALSWAKGYAAPETAAAFARARDLAASNNVFAERFATLYGQWSVSVLRADLTLARQSADAMLADAEKEAARPEIAVGHRTAALTCFLQGAFEEAQSHADEALRIYDPGWNRDTKLRTNHDTAATATMYLALASWILGDADRARKLTGQAAAHALDCDHVPTTATAELFKALFETISNRADTAGRDAQTLMRLMREHAAPTFLAFGIFLHGWARARLGEREAGVAELSEGLTDYVGQGNRVFLPLFWGLLAELEAEGGSAEGALTRVDEALALAAETGERWTNSFLHRIRGEIMLKRDQANTAPAEEAFLEAIAVAQQQKARSFELQAALPLAKLYQSTGRAAAVEAVLAPALLGFSPTLEFQEIAEAQALLAMLP